MKTISDLESTRRKLSLIVIGSAVLASVLILASVEKNFSSDTALVVSSGVGLAFGIVVVIRQKLDGLHGKTYTALVVGLAFWFIAEVTWAVYEIGMGIEAPFPSLADAFWLLGYVFFAYHLYRTYKFFNKTFHPRMPTATALGVSALMAVLFLITTYPLEMPSSDDLLSFVITTTYLIADAVLIIPAVVILSSLWRGKLTSTPWILLSLSLLLVAVADSGFSYSISQEHEEHLWIWDILYTAGYILMAGALYWHNRFMIFDEKKVRKSWQEENR
jgi:hypothetical protein